MGTVAFDTYRFVKHLTESGFTEQQAEALAEEQTAVLNGNLATKADIKLVKVDIGKLEVALKGDIGRLKVKLEGAIELVKVDLGKLEVALKADIKVEIAQAKYETIKWTIGIVLAVAALQTTVILRFLS